MPLRTQPQLLWAHWLVKNNALASAMTNWADIESDTLAMLGFDWAWTYGLANVYLKPDQELLKKHVDAFIEQLPQKVRRTVWDLSQSEKISSDNSNYKKIQTAWRTLFKNLNIGLNDIASRPGRLPPGSAVAFIESAQHATYEELVNFSLNSLSSIMLPYYDFNKHRTVLAGAWSSPMGGLFLLAGAPLLSATLLLDHHDVAPLMGLMEVMGLDMDDSNTVRQLIKKTMGPVLEPDVPMDACNALF